MTKEVEIERELIKKLADLKYSHRDDVCDREALERNFREKFEALNRVRLTDSEFERLLEEIVTPDVFATAERLRNWNTFEREDGTPLHYQLVNLQDWCRNSFEVGPPPLKWSAVMFRKRRIENGKQTTEAGRDCLEVAAG